LKLEIVVKFGSVLSVVGKPSSELELPEFISQFSEQRCRRYWSLNGFSLLKIETNCKTWVWKEKSVEPSMCSCPSTSYTSLSMKQGNLFCFCYAEISQIMILHATCLVFLESSQWVGVDQIGFRLFGALVWKLWLLNHFLNEN
jgi:hypothetical protein